MHPLQIIKDELRGQVPKDVLDNLPRGWNKLGKAIVINLDNIDEAYKEKIAKSYMSVLNVKSVLSKSYISGEYRKPNYEHLAGVKNPTVKHKENGIIYKFNPQKIMFSPSNESERKRMKNISIENNEVLVDMFAGIGHLSIPLTLGTKNKNKDKVELHALEKNSYTYKFLNKTIEANNIKNYHTYNMDSRNFPRKNFSDRILMGYVRKTHFFLDDAYRILKPKGTIHYHETVPEHLIYTRPIKRLKKSASKNNYRINKINFEKIKKYAPGVWHIVLDAKVEKGSDLH